MNDYTKFLTDLISMGMNERNAKVYLALLRKRDASLSDLHKLSGVRQNKLYEVINNLIREGYCAEKKIGRKRFFNVIDPGTSIGSSLKKMEERLEKSYKLKNALEEIYHNTDEIKEPFEYIEVFHGNDNIHHHYCKLVKNSKEEILSFTREPFAFHTTEKQKEQEEVINNFLTRKGTVKSIYEKAFYENNSEIYTIEESGKIESEVRIADNLPLKMFVFDRKTLLISDETPLNIGNELRMVTINQQTIVNAFIALFDFFWEHSIDIKIWETQINKK